LEALYVLAITAGLRKGEILGLRWDDVDFEGGMLQVTRILYKGDFTSPKTAKGRRTVKLTARAVEALRRHREAQLEECKRVEGLRQDHGLVFTTQVGTPINRHNCYARNFKPILEKAGLHHTVRFLDLRHTCATLLLGRRVHPKLVQHLLHLLGHASITMTLDRYSHWIASTGRYAANSMDEALA
jgi:integrase